MLIDGTATGVIIDDDPLPSVSIGNGSATEGDAVHLPITLSAASGRAVTVRGSTSDGTASAGDYTAQSDVLVTIPPGQTQGELVVPTTDDSGDEPDETFSVTLSQPVNATLLTTTATGTVVDDDVPPVRVSLHSAASVSEGATLRFPVTLNRVCCGGCDGAVVDGERRRRRVRTLCRVRTRRWWSRRGRRRRSSTL